MNKKNGLGLLVVTALVCFSNLTFAQIDPLYAQYLNNPLVINPAYTGFNKELNATASFRKQWAGFDGSPTTINFTIHSSLFDNKMGAGLIVVSDKVGENNNTIVMGTYGYKITAGNYQISFGLQGGLVNYRSDNMELNIEDELDPYFAGNQNITKPTFGAGLILSSDNLFVGLSVPRMLSNKETFDSSTPGVDPVEASLYAQNFYGMLSYIFLLNERVSLKPSALLKYVKGNPLSADLNALFTIDERFGLGAFTRNFNTYGVLAQIKFAQGYRFGYAFELPVGQSVGVNFTTHEITLGMSLSVFDFHDITSYNRF